MTETLQTAEANSGNVPRASANVRHLSRMELPGGGQVVVQGKYAFVGHQHRPDGTTILDISDPRKPVIVSNQAMMWDCLRLAGVNDRRDEYGRLFKES